MNDNISSVVTATLCIHMVLMSVDNMYYEDNTPFEINRGVKILGYGLTQKCIKEDVMDCVFDEVQKEIFDHVSEYYFTISEEDVKNS